MSGESGAPPEMKNRIRVYIRDWNTLEEFNRYGTSQGAEGNPDQKGVESVQCDYELSDNVVFDKCNDAQDWDDLLDERAPSHFPPPRQKISGQLPPHVPAPENKRSGSFRSRSLSYPRYARAFQPGQSVAR
jgi:hypothetical protein